MKLKMDHIMDMKMTKKTYKILDFGMHPYADTFINKNQINLSEPVYPLELYLDEDSGYIQTGCSTNDFERYNLYSYSYTSSNSNFSRNHWISFYDSMINKFDLKDKKVIEVGSNDGFLLNMFKDSITLGIDSSKEMCEISNTLGIESINKTFNHFVAKEVLHTYGKCDLLIANNVFNHSNDPIDFAKGVEELLNDNGTFVCEMPYWLSTVESGKFDQIYHEHVSYFTAKSLFNLLKVSNLEIFDMEIVDYHGGSIRIYARKSNMVKLNKIISDQILIEEKFGIFNPSFYVEWQNKIEINRNNFLLKLYKIKSDSPNSIIIGVGAAAKANTFLNYYKLDKSLINYITDSSEYKIGKLTPLTRIPIVSDNIFSKFDDVYAIILSWNISNDLRNILLKINSKIKFIDI